MGAVSGIQASVGRGGANRSADVARVQRLLNTHLSRLAPGTAALAADGIAGPKTVAAIEDFQRRVVGMARPAGMEDLLIKNYGYSKPGSLLETWARKTRMMPEWIEARSKHLPPRPMKSISPK